MAANMAHLKLTVKNGEIKVTADGVDITKGLLARGANLDLSQYPVGPVTLRAELAIDEVDVDTDGEMDLQ